MFLTWKNTFSHISDIPSCIQSQFLWFNDFLKIENETFHFKEFSENNINFIYHLFKEDGVLKAWIELKQEFLLIVICSLNGFNCVILFGKIGKLSLKLLLRVVIT